MMIEMELGSVGILRLMDVVESSQYECSRCKWLPACQGNIDMMQECNNVQESQLRFLRVC